jgi:hypothetical protein
VFLTWPVAPPRFAVPGMNDILLSRDILGSADPHGVTSAVNLYAAMPSLHICWAAWCAAAVVTATRSRWRHLAWLYPAATTFVVLASANHFVLDVIGGLTIAALGLAATRIRQVRAAGLLRSPGAAFQAAPPSPAAETQAARTRMPLRPAALGLVRRRDSAKYRRRPERHQDGRPPVIHGQETHGSEIAMNALCQGGLRGNLSGEEAVRVRKRRFTPPGPACPVPGERSVDVMNGHIPSPHKVFH